MHKIKKYIKLLIALTIIINLYGCSNIMLEGKVTIKGNEPHTDLVLVTEKYGDVKITGKYTKEIQNKYQQQYIKVKGIIKNNSTPPFIMPEFEITEIIEVKK